MAFLSGVLGAVKNENEVTTYDNYISDKNNRLENVLETLQSSIGSGRDGLAVSVAEVKGWLEGYEGEVNGKNDEITSPLKTLISEIDSKKTEISQLQGQNYDEENKGKLSTWVHGLSGLTDKAQDSLNALNNIDKHLNNILYPHVNMINYAAGTFRQNALNGHFALVKVCDKVDEQIKIIKDYARQLESDAELDINKFVRPVEVKLSRLVQRNEWLNNACRYANKQLKDLRITSNDIFRNAQANVGSVKSLNTYIQGELNDKVIDITRQMVTFVSNFRDHVFTPLDGAVTQVYNSITELYNVVDPSSKVQISGYKGVADIVNYVEGKVLEIQGEVGTGKDTRGSIYQQWEVLKGYIEDLVKQIKGEGVSGGVKNDNGLQQIVEGVKKYAQGFSDDTLEATILRWVTEIVDAEDTIVSSKIREYTIVHKNQFQNATRTDRVTQVKEAIKSLLRGFIDTYVKAAASEHLSDANVSNIADRFNSLAVKIERELTDDKRGSSLMLAVTRIESHLHDVNPSLPANNDVNLTSAVRSILKSVAKNFTQVAKELQRFTDSSKISNVPQILNNVARIGKEFVDKQGDYGPQITDRLLQVTLTINTLHSQLKTAAEKSYGDSAIPQAGTAQNVDAKLKEVQVKIGSLVNDMRREKNKLDAAIADVLEPLTKVGTFSSAISNSDSGIPWDVEALKRNITELQTKFGELIAAVTNAKLLEKINEVNRVLGNAKTNLILHIHEITNQFSMRATNAQVAIKKEWLAQFAQFKVAELQDLMDVVNREMKIIDDNITTDGSSGVKGLINTMHRHQSTLFQVQSRDKLCDASEALRWYPRALFMYVMDDVEKLLDLTKETKHKNVHYSRVDRTFKKLQEMLQHLKAENHYDHKFTQLFAELQKLLAYLHPSSFAHIAMPVVAAIKGGVTGLTNQLQTVYVSAYDGEKIDWTNDEKSKEHCAKAFVTLMYTLYQRLHEVYFYGGKKWSEHKVDGTAPTGKDGHAMKDLMKRSGYKIEHLEKHNGHAVALCVSRGFSKHGEFNKNPKEYGSLDDCMAYFKSHGGLLSKLFGYLEEYNDVGHMTLRPKPRHPSSVYDALVWLTGLTHTRVRSEMLAGPIQELFENPDETEAETDDGIEMSMVSVGIKPVEAHPKPIVYDSVSAWLDDMCSKSYDLLMCIVGPGDAATYYGCDYCNNALNLYYPADPAECFDLMCDMLGRIYSPLKFLFQQCRNSSSEFGWSDCLYGRDVALTKWHCGQHSSGKAECQANGQPNCQSKCQPTCRPTSPLMSYLSDALPGHLPHKLSAVGCKYKCSTCSSGSRSMPCLTPLGFRAFSGSTKKGEDICSLLKEICGDDGVLTSLVSSLTCLVGGPPKTLPDIFTFYYNIIRSWSSKPVTVQQTNLIEQSISDKILETVGCKQDDAMKLLDCCRELYTSTSHSKHNIDSPDLKYLAGCGTPNCGAFFLTLNLTAYSTFAPKHAGNYLSWLLYSGWSLVDFIDQLKNAFCSISCYNSDCRGCLNDANCQQGKHGNKSCGCQSIVHCTGVSSVFYKCGLQFVDIQTGTRKKCYNLREALEKLLGSELLNKFLTAIDEFLWTIRTPFSYLVLALWLLSLLYLLHIMVIRLDLLHIKSHLHSPSSHRIAAQSLLAAGRVNKLRRVLYLQP